MSKDKRTAVRIPKGQLDLIAKALKSITPLHRFSENDSQEYCARASNSAVYETSGDTNQTMKLCHPPFVVRHDADFIDGVSTSTRRHPLH